MIVILVSNLFEDGNWEEMPPRVAKMTAAGAQAIVLLAPSDDGAHPLPPRQLPPNGRAAPWARGVQGRSAVAASGRSAFLQGELYGMSPFDGPAG